MRGAWEGRERGDSRGHSRGHEKGHERDMRAVREGLGKGQGGYALWFDPLWLKEGSQPSSSFESWWAGGSGIAYYTNTVFEAKTYFATPHALRNTGRTSQL